MLLRLQQVSFHFYFFAAYFLLSHAIIHLCSNIYFILLVAHTMCDCLIFYSYLMQNMILALEEV